MWVNLKIYFKERGIDVLRVFFGGGVYVYFKDFN